MKRLKTIKIKWVILLLLVVLMGTLAIWGTNRYFSNGGQVSLDHLFRAETLQSTASLLEKMQQITQICNEHTGESGVSAILEIDPASLA